MALPARDLSSSRHRVFAIATVFLCAQIFGAVLHSHAHEDEHHNESECHICLAVHEPAVDTPNCVSVFIPYLVLKAEPGRIPAAALLSDLADVVRTRGPPAA